MVWMQGNDINLPRRILIKYALLEYGRLPSAGKADMEKLCQRIKKSAGMSEVAPKSFEDIMARRHAERKIEMEARKARLKAKKDDINNAIEVEISKEPVEQKRKRRRISELSPEERGAQINGSFSRNDTSGTRKFIEDFLKESGFPLKDASILARAIVEENKAILFGGKPKMADKLVEGINKNAMKMKLNLLTDFNAYKEQNIKTPFLEERKTRIEDIVRTPPQNLYLEYSTEREGLSLRRFLRKDFIRPSGMRVHFVKMMGLMADQGMKLSKKDWDYKSNYEEFAQTVKSFVGKKYQAEIDRALGISGNVKNAEELNALRQKAFDEKSKELYAKMMAGILSLKRRDDWETGTRTDYMSYIKNIERDFIGQMKEKGFISVDTLCFYSPSNTDKVANEFEARRKMQDETADMQVATIHHKRPIAAADDVYERLGLQSVAPDKGRTCAEMTNTLGNAVFVLGKDVHQNLEANGTYVLKSEKDNMIFAADVDPVALASIKLVPSYLKEAIGTLKIKEKGMLQMDMNFTDSKYIREQREQLASPLKGMRMMKNKRHEKRV